MPEQLLVFAEIMQMHRMTLMNYMEDIHAH